MEEMVGVRWHRLITRLANDQHAQAAAVLTVEQSRLAILLRALGGDAGLRVAPAPERAVRARRHWLKRIAGTGRRHALAWRDAETLRLPERIGLFADAALNRDLYIWLVALASRGWPTSLSDWFVTNQRLTREALAALPGLRPRYRRLVAAVLPRRQDPKDLPAAEQRRELAIQNALRQPGCHDELPSAPGEPAPVPLWLYPAPVLGTAPAPSAEQKQDDEAARGPSAVRSARARKQGEYVEDIDGRTGLVAFRLESLFSWSEYVPVDRTTDDSDDEDAARVAEDLDRISLTRSAQAPASRLRLELDLPSAAEDEIPLEEGRRLPEWDWRRGMLRPDHCRIVPVFARDVPPALLPERLAPVAARLRQRFEALRPDRLWSARRPRGRALDLEACIRFQAERRRGSARTDAALWRELEAQRRDLACLVLADLSLSTEAWLDNEHQVIDVVCDSLHLLGEALDAGGDRFAFYGFSSKRRDHVRFNVIKNFAEAWGDSIRGRIQALKPGYYTRMGAAIRQASAVLAEQPTSQRLLLLLTDGKPNDLDIYEGRYGVEDTRQALLEARRLGVEPFCVTIDQDAADYLPYIFGQPRYVLLRKPVELPDILPKLYLLLTGRPS
ncbi:MAG: VWA domain-containing protein [Nitrococcus sp.]|nr:VWA domain-containing protein [Nitrococcus sp.]